MGSGQGKAYLLAFLILFIVFFAISQGAVIWAYLSEIFPTAVRSRGQALGSATHWGMNAIIGQAFPMVALYTQALPFVFFAVCMVLQFFVVLAFFPETRGVELEKMEQGARSGALTGVGSDYPCYWSAFATSRARQGVCRLNSSSRRTLIAGWILLLAHAMSGLPAAASEIITNETAHVFMSRNVPKQVSEVADWSTANGFARRTSFHARGLVLSGEHGALLGGRHVMSRYEVCAGLSRAHRDTFN